MIPPRYTVNRATGETHYHRYDRRLTDTEIAAIHAAFPDVHTSIVQCGNQPGFALVISADVSRDVIERALDAVVALAAAP